MKIFIIILSLMVIPMTISKYDNTRMIIELLCVDSYERDQHKTLQEAYDLDNKIQEGIINSGNIETIISFDPTKLQSKEVIVSAYNNLKSQCDSTPNICAWGDRIRPGIIAVSRNLLKEGLGRNVKVFIEGIGEVEVLDKMNKRYVDRVDLFVGSNIQMARNFGVKKLKMYWR